MKNENGQEKSAILKGQTLVNLAGWNNIKTLDSGSISNNVATDRKSVV